MAADLSFADAFAIGKKYEDAIERMLQKLETPYRQVTDLTEQHLGDFFLENSESYIEVKADALFDETGNLFFEVAETYDSDFAKEEKRDSTELVGVLKHSANRQKTFVAHKLGVEGDKWLVYRPDLIAERLFFFASCHNASVVSSWGGHKGKKKVGILLRSFLERGVDSSWTYAIAIADGLCGVAKAMIRLNSDEIAYNAETAEFSQLIKKMGSRKMQEELLNRRLAVRAH